MHVEVAVDGAVRLVVTNRCPPAPVDGRGLGLRAMAERVEAVGGQVTVSHEDRGPSGRQLLGPRWLRVHATCMGSSLIALFTGLGFQIAIHTGLPINAVTGPVLGWDPRSRGSG